MKMFYIGKKFVSAIVIYRYVQLFMPLPRNWNIILENFFLKIFPHSMVAEKKKKTQTLYQDFAWIKVNDVNIFYFMVSLRLRASSELIKKNDLNHKFIGFFFILYMLVC